MKTHPDSATGTAEKRQTEFTASYEAGRRLAKNPAMMQRLRDKIAELDAKRAKA